MGENGRTGEFDTKEAEEEERHMLEWEVGLPNSDDLMPLTQSLIPHELASAFSLTPIAPRTISDINCACEKTLSSICHETHSFSSSNLKLLPSFEEATQLQDACPAEVEDLPESEHQKVKRSEPSEDAESEIHGEDGIENMNDEPSTRAVKRPRLVWTPQLHKRFVDVVGHLGIKNAVPKTIMNLMNVEGLTRENVASHLQKYRLYLKRMQGLSNEESSSSDKLFVSSPAPQNVHECCGQASVQVPYGSPMMPFPYPHGHSHHGVSMNNQVPGYHHGFQSHPYNMFNGHLRDWSGVQCAPNMHYPHATPDNK